MRCALIYNPASGRNRSQREQQVHAVARALTSQGHSVEVAQTRGPGLAGTQAREAADAGTEIIFACGGDGTVHEVMQGLLTESPEPKATLGIIPMGSANALARHLGLSLDPVEAALQQTIGTPVSISVGQAQCGARTRFFLVMAGAGPDGLLTYRMLTTHKSGLGRIAYYLHALKLFITHPFPAFDVQFNEAETGDFAQLTAVAALNVRVSTMGGLFNRITRLDNSLHAPHLDLLIVRPPALLTLPLWFLTGWLGLLSVNPYVRLARVSSFSCDPRTGSVPHGEVDGEWLGRIPMQVSIVPNALRIMQPGLRN
jgi:YegS/Rv2252/BmrU family lipid kinase